MKKEKSCGCLVFDDENKILLVKMKQGHWSFPKGHVEDDESEYQTAIRETKEETNIDCKIIAGFKEINTYSPYPGVMKDVIFFVAKAVNKDIKIQQEEVQESDFYTIDDALELITFDTDKEILIKAKAFYLK